MAPLAILLLACGDDVVTDAGSDGTVQDAIGQDVIGQDVTLQDGSDQDATVADAATDGNGADAAQDAALDGGPAAICVATGGTLTTGSCCKSVTEFPDTCTVGACTCSPGNSHTIQKCQCPVNQCYTQQLGCH